MASSKQLTLFDMGGWKNGGEGQQQQQQGPRIPNFAQQGTSSWGRGAGRGRGGSSFDDDGRGRGGKSRGGRGRGRGRGNNSFRSSDSVICLDDDDALCQQALQQCELAESDVARAFREGQSATNIPGFSRVAGEKWIYPTNRSTRDYQFNISKTALFHNTLVCLPTGLGKTFIAAVVMFNFHRWYPNDLIIFMAPTKPLVKQQLDACHNIVGIDPQVTVELTGSKQSNRRATDWDTKKVFFLTPQVLQSDLQRNESLAEKIRCIVVDEAHKAVGNYSYAQVVSAVVKVNKRFRVLALTATPGNDIQEILKNLLISRIELRTEQSLDVVPYTHNKEVETVVVQLEPYQLSIHEKIKDVYTGKLMQRKILSGNSSCPTAYQLLALRNKFRARPPPHIAQHERGFIEVNFFVCISLAKAIEYLNVHGLRSFYGYLHALLNREKGSAVVASELRKRGVDSILEDIQQKLNISVENSSFNVSTSGLFDTVTEPNDVSLPPMVASVDIEDYLQSHPKMRVLKNIVEKHFEAYASRNESTRVMIFSQFRGSVQEIGNLLNLLQPKVKPMVFMGQATTSGAGGRGLKQKEQIQVVEKFREGGFNVLVATSVGEEGLDIGDVDLIICFDSNKSPTRNIQRMGRTGRQRKGRIIFLLTSGREERLYRESLMQQSAISKKMTDPEKLRPFLYPISPRMFPAGLEPECVMMNVKLSSEMIKDSPKRPHESDSEDDELVEETFDDSDFLRPAKPVKGKKRKTNSKKKNGVKPVVIEEEKPISKEALALKKGFEKMEEKRLEKAKMDTIVLSDDDEGDLPFGNSQPGPIFIDHYSGKNENYEMMCSLFDIHDTTASSSVPPCTYVPLKPALFSWKEEYNILNVENLLLKEIHLHCVREIVDSTVLTGAIGRYCKCGNIGSSKKYEEQENCFDDMETEEVWPSRPPAPELTKSPKKNPLHAIQQLSSVPVLAKSPEMINFVSLPKSKDEKASVSYNLEEDRYRRLTQWSNTQDVYSACVEQNSTAMCGDEDVFDDDFDEFFILNENEPTLLKGECKSEINTPTVIKSPNATVNGRSAKSERTPIMPKLVVTPVVRKDVSSPDVIPCSDDSSTASESEFENIQENTQSKYFTLKSKSEQHFANYKQKCAATVPAFPTFQIRPPATSIRSRLPGTTSSQARDNCSNKLVASQSTVSEALESCRKDRNHVGGGMNRFRSSPNLGSNKSFTFKRFTSAKRSCEPDIPRRASPELASQSMLSEGLNSPVAAVVSPTEQGGSADCVLATSSDDEAFGVNSKGKSEDNHSDADSDETRWDPEELPPSPVLCRSQQSFQDFRSSSAPEIKDRKSVGFNPDISPDSSHNRTSASGFGEVTVNRKPNDTPTKWMPKSPDFRHSNRVADESQDIIFIGTAANKESPSRLERSSHEFIQPTSNKKPKFVFQRKPKKIEESPLGRSKYFTSPIATLESPKRTATSLPTTFSDDAIGRSSCVSPVPMSPARAVDFQSPDVDSPDFVVRRNNFRRPIMYSDERPSQQLKPSRRKTKKRVKNPFVLEEAEGSSDDSSGDDRNDFANSVDASFVVFGDEDEEDADAVSSSQQHAMYLRSVKDVVPVRLGRIENPLPPQERYLDETDYMNDSFCDDDVEFADVGVYTQAMITAREEVDNERRNGRLPTRRLRKRR